MSGAIPSHLMKMISLRTESLRKENIVPGRTAIKQLAAETSEPMTSIL